MADGTTADTSSKLYGIATNIISRYLRRIAQTSMQAEPQL